MENKLSIQYSIHLFYTMEFNNNNNSSLLFEGRERHLPKFFCVIKLP